MNKRTSIFLLLFLLPFCIFGQATVRQFSQEQLLWFVKNYHPISIQAELTIKRGESTVRQARGGFDPYLSGRFDQKQFDDKNYYSLLQGGLKIPTWYGVSVKSGYDQNSGILLNPENDVPNGGLWYGGIELTLGKGLFIDNRRAALKQAKIFSESTYSEQQMIMNDLYFDAVKQYWKWQQAWNQLLIYEESLQLAQTRFVAVKGSHRFGDKPAIDTLEAFIWVQNRQMNRDASALAYQNATLSLSNFLWFENNTPLVITDSLIPTSLESIVENNPIVYDTLESLMLALPTIHPAMQLYRFKLADIGIDRRMNVEALKPTLNVQYNLLNEPVGSNVITGLSSQNSKVGVFAGFPLFLRKQRGDLQLTDLKIQETELGQQQKLLELQNNLRAYYNEQLVLNSQVALYTDAVSNSNRLLAGEKQKFSAGESSVFMVNTRENYVISTRLKLIELITKYQVAQTGIFWAAGQLYEN
ncbi:MAG: outer membrane protein TolC [Bacteroidia bacterium]|jgi:outer membrane protein TolC